MNTHLHITSWVLALILLIVVVMLHKQGKAKGAKITQMIMRLDYLLILYSGGGLLGIYFGGPNVGLAIVKAIAGLWAIAAIEMTAIKTVKDERANSWWMQLVISLVITFILGFGFL
ncbi:MAG TPA: YisL family protein [Bacillota bacterium]